MGVSVPPDRIGDVVRQFFTGMQVPDVAPDATTVARGIPPRAPVATIGAAMPHMAQPVRGVLGALLSAGPVGERLLRHPVQSAAEATGVPAIGRGLRDQDFGELIRGALAAAPLLGALRGAGPAAEMAMPMQSRGDADMLRNLMESGFAGGKPATAVELPVSGAGRGGSTATAMAAARKLLDPTQLRAAVRDEIARRGGAASPEVEMAATEEVARRLASHGLLMSAGR